MATGKSVLITGCSDGGIGSALAAEFQRRGYQVFATARDLSKMSALRSLHNITLLPLDVVNQTQISAAFEAVKDANGGSLDILINNAARNHFSPVLDINITEAKNIFDTNVWGPIAMIQAFSPLVIKAKGTVVSITSISGHVNVPHMGLYAASKRSLEIVTETLRLEVEPFGVKVLSVVTGAVQSQGQTYFGDWSLPEASLYKPIEDLIHQRTQRFDSVKRESTSEYARNVVNDILNGATGKVWRGGNAGGTKFGSSHLPQSFMDGSVAKGTGLDLLSGHKV